MKAIQDTLHSHLNTFTSSAGLLVIWPNMEAPPTSGTYLRPTLRMGYPTTATLGPLGKVKATGLFFIDIISPLGVGVWDANELADLIAYHFRRGVELPLAGATIPLRIMQSHTSMQRTEETCLFTQVQINFLTYQ